MINSISNLGVGIGFRPELEAGIFSHKSSIDFLEIIADRYFSPIALQDLEKLATEFKIAPYGVGLSIGSKNLNSDYIKSVKEVCRITKCEYYSEHLNVSEAPMAALGHLSPIHYTNDNLMRITDNVNRLQDYLGIPLVLENITYNLDIPKADLTQVEFFQKLVANTKCGILLDMANIYTNSHNHHYDSGQFIDEMPLENIVQIHLAGGRRKGDYIIDSHDEDVEEETWNLLEYLASKIKIKATVLERDGNFPDDFTVLENQLKRAKTILSKYGS